MLHCVNLRTKQARIFYVDLFVSGEIWKAHMWAWLGTSVRKVRTENLWPDWLACEYCIKNLFLLPAKINYMTQVKHLAISADCGRNSILKMHMAVENVVETGRIWMRGKYGELNEESVMTHRYWRCPCCRPMWSEAAVNFNHYHCMNESQTVKGNECSLSQGLWPAITASCGGSLGNQFLLCAWN